MSPDGQKQAYMAAKSPRNWRSNWFTIAAAGAVFVAGLTLAAQTPAPAPAGQTPAAGAPAAAGQAAGAAGAGRAGRGGGGRAGNGEVSDFSPKPAYTPRTPGDEQKGFMMPNGYRMEL